MAVRFLSHRRKDNAAVPRPFNFRQAPARKWFRAKCTACHGLNQIPGSAGFSKEGWAALIATMVALPANEAATVSTYLAANFPEKPGRRPSLVSGEAKIKITEWVTPTLGQRTRDPIEAPDGSIWWTGMWASLVGRLDPKTGAMKEYPLPPTAKPHSIVADKDGNIWYTGNSNATIGKLDPKTGKITEYKTKSQRPALRGISPERQTLLHCAGCTHDRASESRDR